MKIPESIKIHSNISNMVFDNYWHIKGNEIEEHTFEYIWDRTRHLPQIRDEIATILRNDMAGKIYELP